MINKDRTCKKERKQENDKRIEIRERWNKNRTCKKEGKEKNWKRSRNERQMK